MTVNPRLWAQFDEGHALEALCGQGAYYIDQQLFEGHDSSLVLSQLCNWASTRGRVDDASTAFVGALREHVASGRSDGVYSLVWTFMSLSVYRDMPFGLDVDEVRRLLDEADSVDGAAEALARFEGSRTKVAKVRELLAKSDGFHFDVPRWHPPERPAT